MAILNCPLRRISCFCMKAVCVPVVPCNTIALTSVGIGSRGLASSYFETTSLPLKVWLSTRTGLAISTQKSAAIVPRHTRTCQADLASTGSSPRNWTEPGSS